jgi:hypothetical protein
MIPSDITFDGQASPPHWSNKEGDVIEKGTHVRVRLKGVRPNLGSLFAIATINEVGNLLLRKRIRNGLLTHGPTGLSWV